jgi:hypothetical protein
MIPMRWVAGVDSLAEADGCRWRPAWEPDHAGRIAMSAIFRRGIIPVHG